MRETGRQENRARGRGGERESKRHQALAGRLPFFYGWGVGGVAFVTMGIIVAVWLAAPRKVRAVAGRVVQLHVRQ